MTFPLSSHLPLALAQKYNIASRLWICQALDLSLEQTDFGLLYYIWISDI